MEIDILSTQIIPWCQAVPLTLFNVQNVVNVCPKDNSTNRRTQQDTQISAY